MPEPEFTPSQTAAPNFEGHGGFGEHRSVGSHRAWCHPCSEWCYPDDPCRCCADTPARQALVRMEARQIIDSYTLTMVGADAQSYIDACADDVLHLALGWPVTYESEGSS